MDFEIAAPLEAYLAPAPLIDVDHPQIRAFIDEHLRGCAPEEAARRVFHFVRDEVPHSWDIQGHRVTRSASDALACRRVICSRRSYAGSEFRRRCATSG
jgi:GTPase Era involved in 16S rRNA processing